MARPNFFIIGAGKSGTTSLYRLLPQHPEIGMCSTKEPNFFSYDEHYARGWSWYESLFEHAEGKKVIGEASPKYTMHLQFPEASNRIARDVPDAKLIYIVRHPLERLESGWLQVRHTGSWPVPANFNQALREYHMFIDATRYLFQIDQYRRHFSDDQILVLFFEDYKADPDAIFRRCFEFLGVDPSVRIEQAEKRWNTSAGRPVDTTIATRIRSFRLFPTLRDHMPMAVRKTIRRMLQKPYHGRPAWEPETHQWVLDQLEAETSEFLERYGKPADFWDLSLPRREAAAR